MFTISLLVSLKIVCRNSQMTLSTIDNVQLIDGQGKSRLKQKCYRFAAFLNHDKIIRRLFH